MSFPLVFHLFRDRLEVHLLRERSKAAICWHIQPYRKGEVRNRPSDWRRVIPSRPFLQVCGLRYSFEARRPNDGLWELEVIEEPNALYLSPHGAGHAEDLEAAQQYLLACSAAPQSDMLAPQRTPPLASVLSDRLPLHVNGTPHPLQVSLW